MNLPEQFRNYKWFAERFFSIRDRGGNIIPYKMNDLQLEMHRNLTGADDVLKARKAGRGQVEAVQHVHPRRSGKLHSRAAVEVARRRAVPQIAVERR